MATTAYYFLNDLFDCEDRLIKDCRLPDTPGSRRTLREELWEHMHKELLPLLHSQKHHQTTIVNKIKRHFLNNERSHRKATNNPVFYYGIGRPISPDEARKCFVYSTIYPFLIPKDQLKLIKKHDGSPRMYNIITAQQQNIHDGFLQLRQTGRLIEKELFEHYITDQSTIWCGQPSVGFPIDIHGSDDEKFIYGNLVSYNFNEAFHPQEPGTLFIQHIPNTMDIKNSQKEKNPPHFFFQCTYLIAGITYLVFYIPDTIEGRIILGLMKDAFKKQNLFAMDGRTHKRVRMGRVHKKTSLYGEYGYPDGTYLERVASELFRLGSSPFISSFSNDKHFDPGTDPYPKEKRFIIKYK